jgi:hypothetical protein
MQVAMELIAEDDTAQKAALNIIVQQLASVACSQVPDEP